MQLGCMRLDETRLSPYATRLQQLYEGRFRARYRHTIRRPKGNLYYAVRKLLGITQAQAGQLFGISRKAWQYRERGKVMYWPLEIIALHGISGLTDQEFRKLLNDIA